MFLYSESAYVKSRTIFEAFGTIEDVMEFSKRYWQYWLKNAFGPSLIQWVNTFYNNISSCVLNKSYSTSPFAVERGVRQGDPLSAYPVIYYSIRREKGEKPNTEWCFFDLFSLILPHISTVSQSFSLSPNH